MLYPTQQTTAPLAELQRGLEQGTDRPLGAIGDLPSDGQDQPAPLTTETQLVDVGGRLMSSTDIRRLLDSRPVIDQAKGVLMGLYGIDADRAFNLLRRWSQTRNERLASISAQVVDAAGTGSAGPLSDLSRVLNGFNSGGQGGDRRTPQVYQRGTEPKVAPMTATIGDRLETVEELAATLGAHLPADALSHLVGWLDRRDRVFNRIAAERLATALEAVAEELRASAAGNGEPETSGLALAARVVLDRAAGARAEA